MLSGQNWDKIYIGFQMMISREPNVYHMPFWDALISIEDKKQRPNYKSLKGAQLTYPEGANPEGASIMRRIQIIWIVIIAIIAMSLRNYLN